MNDVNLYLLFIFINYHYYYHELYYIMIKKIVYYYIHNCYIELDHYTDSKRRKSHQKQFYRIILYNNILLTSFKRDLCAFRYEVHNVARSDMYWRIIYIGPAFLLGNDHRALISNRVVIVALYLVVEGYRHHHTWNSNGRKTKINKIENGKKMTM